MAHFSPSEFKVQSSSFKFQSSVLEPSSILAALKWPLLITVPLACMAVAFGLMQFSSMFHVPIPWPRPIAVLYLGLAPFRSFNSYGLFAVDDNQPSRNHCRRQQRPPQLAGIRVQIQTGRPESAAKVRRAASAALGLADVVRGVKQLSAHPWFVNFCVRLLQGSPEVLGLIERNPFPNAPPRYIRAVVYDYRFTDFATRRQTDAWWRRERRGEYLPVVSLRGEEQGK